MNTPAPIPRTPPTPLDVDRTAIALLALMIREDYTDGDVSALLTPDPTPYLGALVAVRLARELVAIRAILGGAGRETLLASLGAELLTLARSEAQPC